MSPLLSVVVPTHNRSAYAISCIEAVLAITTSELQLVMTDTSTDGKLYALLQQSGSRFLEDPRFLYRRIEGPSNLTKNHNDAVALATGEYICIIGDDDCLSSAAVDAARWASANQVPVVSHNQKSIYAWPDFRSILARSGHAARLYVPRRAKSAKWRDGEADLVAALERAFQATEHMPRCYHGIVRRELLERARRQTGAYFHGSSPDMSGAVAMSCLISRYCEADLPLSIAGISSGSNSGRSAMNTHKGELSAETQTNSFEADGWTTGVPRFFAVETVWAHAGLETLRRFRPEAVVRFNYARLLALCSLRHPDFAEKISQAAEEASTLLGRNIATDVAREIVSVRRERWKYLLRRGLIPTPANGRRYFKNVPTVAAAARCYEAYAPQAGLAFDPPSQKADAQK